MSRPVVIQPEARQEMQEAFDWYEEQRAGLGVDFVATIQQSFDNIAKFPERQPKVFRDVRKKVVQEYPYSIFYRLVDDEVHVIAVFHNKRNPRIWKKRAKETS